MPDLMPVEGQEQPTLKLHYETLFPIDAANTGAMVEALGKAFARYARTQRWQHLRLAVVDVGIGSYWIEFAVISAGAVFNYRKEIYDFTAFLGKLLDIAKGLRQEKASHADKKLIDLISSPVAMGDATQVNITIVGGAPTIIIDRQAISSLWADATDQGAPIHPIDISHARLEVKRLTERPRPALRELDGQFGTIFDVRGHFYVRLEGEGGVLNPVTLASGVTLEDGGVYRFTGSWEGRRYAIRQAQPIGPS